MAEETDLKDVKEPWESRTRPATDRIQVTVSIGIAERSESCFNLDVLIDQADYAMYQAKHAGRNCVKLFSETSME